MFLPTQLTHKIFVVISTLLLIASLGVQLTTIEPTIDLIYRTQAITDPSHQESYKITAKQSLQPLIQLSSLKTASEAWQEIKIGNNAAYTESEISHLVDLKRIYDLLRSLGVMSLITMVLMYRSDSANTTQGVKTAIHLLAVTLISLVILFYFAWDRVFIIFHQVFFPHGNWSFPLDSALILLFPVQFWQGVALALGLHIAFLGLSIYFLSETKKKSDQTKTRSQKKRLQN